VLGYAPKVSLADGLKEIVKVKKTMKRLSLFYFFAATLPRLNRAPRAHSGHSIPYFKNVDCVIGLPHMRHFMTCLPPQFTLGPAIILPDIGWHYHDTR
jgi:hypothetical protein